MSHSLNNFWKEGGIRLKGMTPTIDQNQNDACTVMMYQTDSTFKRSSNFTSVKSFDKDAFLIRKEGRLSVSILIVSSLIQTCFFCPPSGRKIV